MEMTRRQFALSIAAASSLPSSLFEPTAPIGVPRPRHLGARSRGRDVGWDRLLVGRRQQQPGCD
jgi:hypothetical protein